MKVPWAKLYIDDKERESVLDSLKSTWLSMGPKVAEFERTMAGIVGVNHAIAVNSGTAALDIALKLLEIAPEDEVIIPAMTYIATANAVLYQHATPVFADIDPVTYNIDTMDVRKKITNKTKSIIAIDYGGNPANYQELKQIAVENNIHLIEDGAPGLGGKYYAQNLCSLGDISTTSFHAAKIFTTIEGGMLFTDNKNYDKTARIIRSQGEDPDKKYHHPILGHNYRMTDLNAAIGLAQISRYDEVLNSRNAAANYYLDNLRSLELITLPSTLENTKNAWFLFPILLQERDKVKSYLEQQGITTNISWPNPIYDQPFYQKHLQERCKITDQITSEVLCLPLYFGITNNEQDYVIKHLKDALSL